MSFQQFLINLLRLRVTQKALQLPVFLRLRVTQKALQLPFFFFIFSFSNVFQGGLPKVFYVRLSTVTKDACDQYRSYFIEHTKRKLLK